PPCVLTPAQLVHLPAVHELHLHLLHRMTQLLLRSLHALTSSAVQALGYSSLAVIERYRSVASCYDEAPSRILVAREKSVIQRSRHPNHPIIPTPASMLHHASLVIALSLRHSKKTPLDHSSPCSVPF